MTAQIRISGVPYEKSFLTTTIIGQSVLRESKDSSNRPVCLCSKPHPEMYISRRGGRFYLARMPGSANQHEENCQSHIVDVDFCGHEELTAEEVLRQIWRNLTSKGMPEKTNWIVIEKSLHQAITDMHVDGCSLPEHLLVPQAFDKNIADQLHEKHLSFYRRQSFDTNKQVRYWTLGILKDCIERQYNFQASLKHLPSIKFWVHKEVAMSFPMGDLHQSDRSVMCLFSCRLVKSGVEVDEAGYLVVDNHLKEVLPNSSTPTKDQIQLTRKLLGLPETASAEVIFHRLVKNYLDANTTKIVL